MWKQVYDGPWSQPPLALDLEFIYSAKIFGLPFVTDIHKIHYAYPDIHYVYHYQFILLKKKRKSKQKHNSIYLRMTKLKFMCHTIQSL